MASECCGAYQRVGWQRLAEVGVLANKSEHSAGARPGGGIITEPPDHRTQRKTARGLGHCGTATIDIGGSEQGRASEARSD
jgi:hypothetical protein